MLVKDLRSRGLKSRSDPLELLPGPRSTSVSRAASFAAAGRNLPGSDPGSTPFGNFFATFSRDHGNTRVPRRRFPRGTSGKGRARRGSGRKPAVPGVEKGENGPETGRAGRDGAANRGGSRRGEPRDTRNTRKEGRKDGGHAGGGAGGGAFFYYDCSIYRGRVPRPVRPRREDRAVPCRAGGAPGVNY
jgi:hypothetical protein